jgi:hypothetical protein
VTPYLIVSLLLLAVLAWFFLAGRSDAPEPTAHRRPNDGIDHAELEEAEREVREAEGEDEVRDWGPGSGERGKGKGER